MGVLYSTGCAIAWAFAVVLFRHAVDRVDPLGLNLFRVTLTFPLLVLTTLAAGQGLIPNASSEAYIRLVASAVLGIVIADTMFHVSLRLVGGGITAIVDTLYSPLTVLFAFFLLGERIGAKDYAGMSLIAGGLLLTGTLHPPAGRTRAQLVRGIAIGLTGILFLAIAIVIAKPALDQFSVLWAAAFRQGVSMVLLALMAGISRRRREHFAVLRPSAAWKTMVGGTLLGSYLSLTLWIAGMKYTLAGIAAIITQSSTAYILIFSTLFLKEPFTRRKALAAGLALAGVVLVSLR